MRRPGKVKFRMKGSRKKQYGTKKTQRNINKQYIRNQLAMGELNAKSTEAE